MDAQSRLLDIARLAIEAAGGLRRTNLQVEAEKQQRMGRRAGRCA